MVLAQQPALATHLPLFKEKAAGAQTTSQNHSPTQARAARLAQVIHMKTVATSLRDCSDTLPLDPHRLVHKDQQQAAQ